MNAAEITCALLWSLKDRSGKMEREEVLKRMRTEKCRMPFLIENDLL